MMTPSVPSVRRKTDSAKIKLLWHAIDYKIKTVRALHNLEKSIELLRHKKGKQTET